MNERGYTNRAGHIREVQLLLPFGEGTAEEQKVKKYRTIEQWIRWRYPMTFEEISWLPEGVGLARFVPLAECESCNFACEDHCVDNRFPQSVCLKDLRAKEKA